MSLKFSIICPCFNSQYYVRNAIESVLNQSYQNLELILIDDGSMDSTLEILNEYKDKDNRVVVFHKDNGGYCSAVNLGLEHITGDYFLLMGSDDYLDENILLNIIKKMKNAKPDIIGFKTMQITAQGIKQKEINTDFKRDINFNGDYKSFCELYSYESIIFRLRDTSKCFKTSLLNKQRYFGKYGCDADGIFSFLFAHNSNSFMVVDDIGYYWQLRPESVSGRKRSIEVNIDRLNNWTNFIKVLNCSSFEMCDYDFTYSLIGFSICGNIRDVRFNFNDYHIVKEYCRAFKNLYKKNKSITIGKKIKINFKFILLSYILNIYDK